MDEKRRPENPAKIYLRRYRALMLRQDSLRRSIDEIYAQACNVTQNIKPIRVQGGGVTDRMAEDVARISDMTDRLREAERKTRDALEEILHAIEQVPDEMQRTVLTLRYIEGLDWISIAEKIHYEISNTYILHGRALWAVKKWMEEKDCRKM